MPAPSSAAAISARCSSTRRVRTSGTVETGETEPVTCSVRIAAPTSWPSTWMVGPAGSVPESMTGSPLRAATAAGSCTSTPCSSIHQVIARYIAPVSR